MYVWVGGNMNGREVIWNRFQATGEVIWVGVNLKSLHRNLFWFNPELLLIVTLLYYQKCAKTHLLQIFEHTSLNFLFAPLMTTPTGDLLINIVVSMGCSVTTHDYGTTMMTNKMNMKLMKMEMMLLRTTKTKMMIMTIAMTVTTTEVDYITAMTMTMT